MIPGTGKHKGKIFDFDNKEILKRKEKEIVLVQFGNDVENLEIIGLPEGYELVFYYIDPRCTVHKDYAIGVFGIKCPKCKKIL